MKYRAILFLVLAALAPAQNLMDEGTRLYRAGDMAGAAKRFLAAAMAGNSNAQLQIGWHYEFGKGVAQSYPEAAKWYRRAADQGNAAAMKNLGQFYENGEGVPEDWVEAARWYERSAQAGYANGQAAFARAYEFGVGVPQDRRKAIEWDTKAAAQGDEDSAYFAHWLREPTNNIGFRNEEEREIVIGGRLRTALLGGDPAGIMFRNSTERLAWLWKQRKDLDRTEAQTMYNLRLSEYNRCRSRGQGYCTNPGPAPR